MATTIGAAALPDRYFSSSVAGSPGGEFWAAPCLPGEPVEIMHSPHISRAELAAVEYNSMPPTSGPHFGFAIAPGAYRWQVSDGLTVHALEHGHIVIHYATDTSEGELDALTALTRRYSADVVLSPYETLPSGIALTAWGRIDRLDQYDESRIVEFIEQLRGRYVHGWTVEQDCP